MTLLTAELFPHALIRPGQDELVNDIDAAMKQQKILIAHAPTGLGKTASALSVALQYALEQNKRVFFLTNRHTQHQIAVNTLKLMKEKTGKEISCADLIGKRWMCSHDVANLFGNEFNEFCKKVVEKGECEFYNNVRTKDKLKVEAKALVGNLIRQGPLHNEEVMAISKEKTMCSYEVTLALAKDSRVIIGDYYYAFNPHVKEALFNKLEIKMEDIILVVDEGHNLPGRVRDMLSSDLTSIMIRNAALEAKRYNYGGLIRWLQGLGQILQDWTNFPEQELRKERLVRKEEFITAVQNITGYDTLINELDIAAEEVRKKQRKSSLGGIAAFLGHWKGTDTGFCRFISIQQGKYGPFISLSYSCLDPSIVTKDIFSTIHSGVIMSGTLKPTFMYKDILGIERGVEKEYSSPFPPENKCTLIIPETTTKYTLRGEAMYLRIAQKCSQLAALIPGNVAFFFSSYSMRDAVGRHITAAKKIFWEKKDWSKEEKEVFLNQFRQERNDGGVLLGVNGANFAEGIDLPGDLLNGVVVVGLPLAPPDIKTKELIRYYNFKFDRGWDYGYVYPAMNKCLQSAGRCIRSETDRGAVIYLDERFAWQQYFICFPREGLIVSTEYERLLQEFFGKSSEMK